METADLKILKAIGAKPEGKYFALPKPMKALFDAKLVEANPDSHDPKDPKKIAFRLTEAGLAEINKPTSAKSAAKKAPSKSKAPAKSRVAAAKRAAVAKAPTSPLAFNIADIPIPAPTRNHAGSKYPFDQLANGQSFFVPSGGDVSDPTKSFGSTVSAANGRYTDRRFVSRTIVLDAATAKVYGHPVGTRGLAVFRMPADEEKAALAKSKKTK